jgi:hypothetical protein
MDKATLDQIISSDTQGLLDYTVDGFIAKALVVVIEKGKRKARKIILTCFGETHEQALVGLRAKLAEKRAAYHSFEPDSTITMGTGQKRYDCRSPQFGPMVWDHMFSCVATYPLEA